MYIVSGMTCRMDWENRVFVSAGPSENIEMFNLYWALVLCYPIFLFMRPVGNALGSLYEPSRATNTESKLSI